jgi:hypothetical protein
MTFLSADAVMVCLKAVNTAKGLFYEGKKWYQLSSTPILCLQHYSDCKTRNMGVELMTINHAGSSPVLMSH